MSGYLRLEVLQPEPGETCGQSQDDDGTPCPAPAFAAIEVHGERYPYCVGHQPPFLPTVEHSRN